MALIGKVATTAREMPTELRDLKKSAEEQISAEQSRESAAAARGGFVQGYTAELAVSAIIIVQR